MKAEKCDVIIGVVGVCASGKSTLIAALSSRGYTCKHIAQEHSYVQNMWKRLVNPDILIYLSASYETTLKRKNLNWTMAEYLEQIRRLDDACQQAQIKIITDNLLPDELIEETEKQILSLLQPVAP